MNLLSCAADRFRAVDTPIRRAVIVVPVVMALWWFVLKGASLWLLRMVAYVPLGMFLAPAGAQPVTVNPNTGEWVFNVAVHATVTRAGQAPQTVEDLGFAVDADSIAYFSSGWFAYLAAAISAGALYPGKGKRWLLGLGLQTVVGVLSLMAYVYINAYGYVINSPQGAGQGMWLLNYIYHLIYLVIPFAGPFLIAMLVHPEWRKCFRLPEPEPVPARVPQRNPEARAARRRAR